MTQKLLPACYIIVPSERQGKTVQIENGKVDSNVAIVVGDRIPRGRKDFSSQLWLWDGTYFHLAKHPSYCIKRGGGSRHGEGLKLGNYTIGKHGGWTFDLGTITSNSVKSIRWDLEGNTVVQNRKLRSATCFWRLEMVTSNVRRLGFGPFYREQTCVIVPAHSLGKTVQLDDGSTEEGTLIRLANRRPNGQRNYVNQLWLWNGTTFRSAKDPSKALYVTGPTRGGSLGYVKLGEVARLEKRRGQINLARWVVKRNFATGLYQIRSANFGQFGWFPFTFVGANDIDDHGDTPIHIRRGWTCFWKIEMVRGVPTKGPPARPDQHHSRHTHHSHL